MWRYGIFGELLITNYQFSTVNCQLSTVNYQLSTINYQLLTYFCYSAPSSHVKTRDTRN
ncbi:MAG: hypothetical protein HC894_12580 [Microcoleus sp. SM1_3_4]|nr:hypothetical protein [Microcoleus sp. SM1_3_4]